MKRLRSSTTTAVAFGPVVWMLGAGGFRSAWALIVLAGIGLLAGSATAAITAFPVSMVVGSAIFWLVGQLMPAYSVSGTVLLSILGCLWIVAALILGQLSLVKSHEVSLIPAALWAVVTCLLTSSPRGWTPTQAFGILASNGEDNAAWLISLSRSVRSDETVLSSLSSLSGGSSSGLMIASVRQLMQVLDPDAVIGNAGNGLVLTRMYPMFGVLGAVMMLAIVQLLLESQPKLVTSLSYVALGLVTHSFALGFATVGHLSGLIAVYFLISALLFVEAFRGSNRGLIRAGDLLVSMALFASGQTWFPLTLLLLFYGLVRITQGVFPMWESGTSSSRARALVGFIAGSLSLFLISRRVFPDSFGNVLSLDYVRKNMALSGAYPMVNSWVVVIAVVGSTWFGWQKTDLSRTRMAACIALVFPAVGVFVASYFVSPYSPQYGPWKYLYIMTAAVAPYTLILVIRYVAALTQKTGVARAAAVPVLAVAVLGIFSPPFSGVNWASTAGKTRYEWVDVVVSELRRDPGRAVTCLNTIKDDDSQNYMAYLCSRVSFGLGGFDDVRHRVWTAANLCAAPPSQVEQEWTANDQEKLTVILFDGSRLSSGATCQADDGTNSHGWLSSIDWSRVRILDLSGRTKSAEDLEW